MKTVIRPSLVLSRLAVVALAAVALGAAGLAAAPTANADHWPGAQQWGFFDATNPLLFNGHSYPIKNEHIDRYLDHGSRDYGIDLIWSHWFKLSWKFLAQTSPDAPIHFNQRFALLHSAQDRYLSYGERKYGINLVWKESSAPDREWSIRGLDDDGRLLPGTLPVRRDRPWALFNHKVNKYLVYGEREYGINLVWADSI